MINSAQLRVYLPADRIGRFDPHRGTPRRVVRADGEFLWEEPTGDDAYTLTWDGIRYACLRYPRLRMLEGLLAFRDAHPASALAPEPAVRSAVRELARIRSEAPAARSYILTAPWHVPLRWFMCFDPADRELYETTWGTSLRYRTPVTEASERVARGIQILDDAGFDSAIVDDIRDLERWLEEFDDDALLELDYHTVGLLFAPQDLALDDTAADIDRSLDALDRLDYEEAGEAYAEAAIRWAPAQALAYVN